MLERPDRPRRGLVTWAVGALVVVLAGATAAGTLQLRREADLARGQQLALERVRTLANEQSSLEWQAVAAQGAAEELAAAARVRGQAMEAELTRFAALGGRPDDRLEAALLVHQRALDEELQLLAAGHIDAALLVGERQVDPSLGRLMNAIGRTLSESGSRARTASFRATAATGLLLALGALFVVLVVVGFQRSRRTLATADERALRQSERWFQTLVQNSSELIAVVDSDTTVRYVTDSCVPLLGRVPGKLLDRRLADLAHPEDVASLTAAASGQHSPSFECRLRTQDGGWLVLEWLHAIRADEPGAILTGRDVTDRKRLEHELRRMAFHDALTGLANRALFEDRLTLALAALPRRQEGLAVLFVDLDDFKTVNDSLGHAAGDILLRGVGERLRGSLRDSDTAARLGGDEFAILLEAIPDDAAALRAAERIRASLEAPFEVEARKLTVSASVGVAPAVAPGLTIAELMRDADLAMYAAKRRGGAQCRLYEPELHEVALSRLELGSELQRALDEQEFELFFQPIVGLESSGIIGAEALIRWRHPERGLLSPAHFLELAEETGLIVPLGRWVVEEAARSLRRWQDEQPDLPLYVSANVSMRQLYDPGIVEDIRYALGRAQVPPSRLVVEITESFLADESEAPRVRLQRLRALGVRLAVDDFGTGYSALSYLQRFPIDMLKIDRSFVEHARPGSTSLNLVRSIVQLGQSLHLDLVAEGIEEAEQAEQLREMGVPAGQGYHFARPMPADEFAALLGGRSGSAHADLKPLGLRA